MLLAKTYPDEADEALIERLVAIRAQSWPNSRMIAFADDMLGRGGRLTEAVRRLHARQLEAKPHLAQVMRDLGRAAEVEAAQAKVA